MGEGQLLFALEVPGPVRPEPELAICQGQVCPDWDAGSDIHATYIIATVYDLPRLCRMSVGIGCLF